MRYSPRLHTLQCLIIHAGMLLVFVLRWHYATSHTIVKDRWNSLSIKRLIFHQSIVTLIQRLYISFANKIDFFLKAVLFQSHLSLTNLNQTAPLCSERNTCIRNTDQRIRRLETDMNAFPALWHVLTFTISHIVYWIVHEVHHSKAFN